MKSQSFSCDRLHNWGLDFRITAMIFTQQQTTQSRKKLDIWSQSSDIYAMVAGLLFLGLHLVQRLSAMHYELLTATTLEPSFILHKKIWGFLKMHLNKTGYFVEMFTEYKRSFIALHLTVILFRTFIHILSFTIISRKRNPRDQVCPSLFRVY